MAPRGSKSSETPPFQRDKEVQHRIFQLRQPAVPDLLVKNRRTAKEASEEASGAGRELMSDKSPLSAKRLKLALYLLFAAELILYNGSYTG